MLSDCSTVLTLGKTSVSPYSSHVISLVDYYLGMYIILSQEYPYNGTVEQVDACIQLRLGSLSCTECSLYLHCLLHDSLGRNMCECCRRSNQ